MCVPLLVLLSSIVLRSVSAGGVYCAKTARARAAALGLDYPGVHGAPNFFGPAHRGMRPQPYYSNDPELAETKSNTASYRQNQPGGSLFDDTIRNQAHRRSSDGFLQSQGTYKLGRSAYGTDRVLSLPRGQFVSNHESSFEEVKHVALPTLAEAGGQPDLVNGDPQGRNKLLSFVYNEHDLVVDESAPNRRGMSLIRLPLPHSRGHGTYQRDLTGYSMGREVPVLGSSRFINKGRAREMTSRGPVFGRTERVRFPVRPAPYLHRSLHVKPFVKGKAALKRLIEPKRSPANGSVNFRA